MRSYCICILTKEKAMKLLVFACIVAVCYAQPPPPAHIPNTFETQTEKMMSFGPPGHEIRAKGMWARNAEMKEFVEKDEFMDSEGKVMGMHETLGLFQTGMFYRINETAGPNGTKREHCESHKIPTNEEFPDIWAWVYDEEHTTKETKTISGVAYIVYTNHRHGEHGGFETTILEVKEEEPTVPVMEIREENSHKEVIKYMNFMAKTPSQEYFTVPVSCSHPPPKN